MPTDPAVRRQRRETAILAASAILAFVLTEYIAGSLHLDGTWRYAAWFTIGLVLVVVLVTVFTLAAERLFGPVPGIDE